MLSIKYLFKVTILERKEIVLLLKKKNIARVQIFN